MDPLRRRLMLGAATALAGASVARAAENAAPQPIRGDQGADVLGPRNLPRVEEGPDLLVPPATDKGSVDNLHWAFADSHVRIQPGGWAREVTERELPVSKAMAGVNMRLEAGAIRELHWHKAAEWSYMIAGNARVTAVDQYGGSFVDDLGPGDLWYFGSGLPHSIQGLGPDGCEFLLVFNDGSFSEDNTFLLSDWTMRTPLEVLEKDFGMDAQAFDNLPKHELYIFKSPLPPPLDQARINGAKPVKTPMTFRMTAMKPQHTTRSGSVRIVDVTNFPASTGIAAALVEIAPGAMRELHWHPNAPEWQYYLQGKGRMTVFASGPNARTFDYQAGDVGYVPLAMGHYIENTGSDTLLYLEMFPTGHYAEVSLSQWLALTPPGLVKAHLGFSDADLHTLAGLAGAHPVVPI